MSNAIFEAARELIKEKKYNEARAILRTIDDPKATVWIGRINDLLWADVKPEAKASPKASYELPIFFAVLALVVIGVVAFTFVRTQREPTVSALSPVTLLPTSTPMPTATNMPVVVTATAVVVNPSADDGAPLVPPAPSPARLNTVVNKCTGVIQQNPALYKTFLDRMIKDIYARNIEHLGTTANVFMGRYCSMSEAFEVAWVTYGMVMANDSTLNSRSRTSIWTNYVDGWNFSFNDSSRQ